MEWTPAQQRTIEEQGKNILVSAAAGSGKTAVLIERIIRLVLDKKTGLDRFLITTFTDAAAAEMRDRLEKAIMKELQKPDSDKVFLRKQLSLLPTANISTVHKYALEVIRSFFYLTDLEPGFTVSDEIQSALTQQDAMNELFERRFEEGSPEFLQFLRRRSKDRSDDELKRLLLETYNAMRSIPHYMDWAKKSTELLQANDPLAELNIYRGILQDASEASAKALRLHSRAMSVVDPVSMPQVYGKLATENMDLQGLATAMQEVLAKVSRGDISDKDAIDITGGLFDVSFDSLGAKKEDDKDAYNLIKKDLQKYRTNAKKAVTDMQKKYFAGGLDEYADGIRATYEDTKYFVGLLEEFEQILKEKKAEDNCIDFDDIMHYAIQVLSDEKAAEEYREKFEYIFVDEYQDSNQLQEEIVNSIARDNNVFMVGDVKQSIYKFRQAEPELFLRKYEEYKAEEKENSIKIDLNSNFRSKKRVTEAVNRVFEKIMPGYDDDAKLHCSIDESYPGEPIQMHIIDKEGIDEEFINSSDAESELAAEIIKNILGKDIYDSKSEVMRQVGYGDIAVLSRGGTVLADMERFLNNAGIPAYAQNSDGYYETVEVQVFINILHIIDNMSQDVPLISTMRSVVFGFGVDELAKIRIFSPEGSFSRAVRQYAESGPDEAIRDKINDMIQQIRQWKEIQKTAPLDELLRMVMYDTGYYNYCSGLPAGTQRISNLRILLEKATSYEDSHYDGLYGFLNYIEAMKNSNKKVGEASISGAQGDTVNLMTVHKSKGLEFPIVILVGTGKQTGSGGNNPILHKDFAIGLKQVSEDGYTKKKTLLQQMIRSAQAREGLDEEVRILYVALTRAKDQLITIGTVNKMEKLDEGLDTGSYIEMMYETISEMQAEDPDSAEVIIHNEVLAGQSDEVGRPALSSEMSEEANQGSLSDQSDMAGLQQMGTDDMASALEIEPSAGTDSQQVGTGELPSEAGESVSDADKQAAIDELVNTRLSYEYPYPQKEGSKPKYSVSELNRREAGYDTNPVIRLADMSAGSAAGAVVPSGSDDAAIPIFRPATMRDEGQDIEGMDEFAEAGSTPPDGTAEWTDEELTETGVTGKPQQKGKLSAAQVGTAMHYVMERLDFARAEAEGESYIKAFAEELLEKGLLSQEEHEAIRTDRIASFFDEEVGKRAAKAFASGQLRKEAEFILRKEVDGEKAIVQGIIDCYFEDEDGLVLIDYKNSWIGGSAVEERVEAIVDSYRNQIRLYEEALEASTGKPVSESYLYLFQYGKPVKVD